jgi:hypothetical protein
MPCLCASNLDNLFGGHTELPIQPSLNRYWVLVDVRRPWISFSSLAIVTSASIGWGSIARIAAMLATHRWMFSWVACLVSSLARSVGLGLHPSILLAKTSSCLFSNSLLMFWPWIVQQGTQSSPRCSSSGQQNPFGHSRIHGPMSH